MDARIGKLRRNTSENAKTGGSEILASEVYTSPGIQTITWTGNRLKKSYRFIITTGGFNYISMDNTSITFEITGATPSVAVTVYGDSVNGAYAGFSGEAVKAGLIEEGEGYTRTVTNRFVQSDAEAGEIAEALIARFSDDTTALQGSLSIDGMPLLEINDLILALEINTNTFQLFVIEGISISYDAEGARYKQSLQIRSIGNTLSEIVYDRNLALNGIG